MKKYVLTLFPVIMFCAFMACNTDFVPDGGDTVDNKTITDYDDTGIAICFGPPLQAQFQIEMVNNTGGALTVGLGIFRLSEDGPTVYYHSNEVCVIAENSKDNLMALWSPKDYLPYDNTCSDPPLKQMQTRFRPSIDSFYLRIQLDDAEYYLAGWPQSIKLPPVMEYENMPGSDYYGETMVFDTSKILRYGIGYGDNSEVRIGYVDRVYLFGNIREEYAYLPWVIKTEGQTYDFGDSNFSAVSMRGTITIDSPDKIDVNISSVVPAMHNLWIYAPSIYPIPEDVE